MCVDHRKDDGPVASRFLNLAANSVILTVVVAFSTLLTSVVYLTLEGYVVDDHTVDFQTVVFLSTLGKLCTGRYAWTV